MKKEFLHFTLYAIIIYLTSSTLNLAIAATQLSVGNGTHLCGVIDPPPDKQGSHQYPNRRYARTSAANLNVGEPRTVRMIYFLPNDWQYRADVVQKMKDAIRTTQTFYAEQMAAHSYGEITFRFETDRQGEPMVHRVDGQRSFSHYDNTLGSAVFNELEQAFDFNANIYFIVLGTDALRQGNGQSARGVGHRYAKNGGVFLVPNEFSWDLVTHELGHTFGLNHDFRDGAYIMSYGPGWNRLSACAAEFLSVHSYFNLDTPIEVEQPPTIKLISPRTYLPGSMSVPVRVQVSDSDGLHQVLLHALGALQLCRNFTGKKESIVEFEYDGGFGLGGFTSFSSAVAHAIRVDIVDRDGNVSNTLFTLHEISPGHIATLEAHTVQVHAVSFSHDSTTLASVGATNLGPGESANTISVESTIKLWDVTTRANIATFGHGYAGISLASSPDGTTLASGRWQTIELWDVATRASIATLRGHTNWVHSVAFSIDRKTLASGAQDNTVKLWDLAMQQNIATFRHTGLVFSVAFSPNGAILASGSEDRTVKLWDVATEQNIATLPHTAGVTSVVFSRDGILASGTTDGSVKLWDVATEQNIATLPHTAGVTSVVFSRDGILASGTTDGSVKLWDVATRADIVSLGHPGAVMSVAFSPDGTTLAAGTGFRAGTVELWDMSELIELRLEAVSEIDIPDSNLRAAIAEAIGLPPNTPIIRGNMATLTELDARNANISDLTGLEGATNLRTLDLGGNSVSDISAVAGLTNLIRLNLNNNVISDVSPLLGLNLTGTSWDSTGVYLERNPLSYASINTHIPAIQAKGVEVKFDNRTATTLLNISGVITASNNTLTVEVRDSNGRIFEGVPVTFTVTSDGGTLSVTNTTTDKKGRAQSTLTLGKESNRVKVSAVGAEQTATFSDVAEAGVHIPDPNLRAAIEDTLGVKSGSPISSEEMTTLTYLRARDASIGVLIGLEFATNLTELRLGDNGITDISPLSGLTNLRRLGLGRNRVTDISPLSELTNLRTLGLSKNGIKDVSAFVEVLSGLTNLTALHLRDNGITDISFLSGLTGLTELRLSYNQITNISALSRLTGLTELHLSSNGITDISFLSRLTGLTELRLSINGITDISALSRLTGLTELRLSINGITNISSLSGLTNLRTLGLSGNSITDISALSGLADLTELRLEDNGITDISPLSGLTNLRMLSLPSGIQDLPALGRVLSGLTHLTSLSLSDNNIEAVSALIPVLSDLTDLRDLNLSSNGITDLSPLAKLTNLTSLHLWNNNISDISPLAELTNLTSLNLWNNNISDISPLVENTGLGVQDWSRVGVRANPLSYQSIHTHIPILQSRGVTVDYDDQAHPALLIISGGNQRRLPGETLAYPFVVEAQDENGSALAGISVTFTVTEGGGTLSIQSTTTDANGRAKSTLTLGPNFGTNTVSVSAAEIPVSVTFNAIADNPEFLWSIPSGISWIHVPLKVTAVDGVAKPITSISDLYDALGGADTVNFLITYDSQTQQWFGYFGPSDTGTPDDRGVTDDTGIIAGMITPVTIRLIGNPLGTNGSSTITLNPGFNLVGLPLKDPRITRVSDLFALDGIGGNVHRITLTDSGKLQLVERAGDPSDIPIMGGQSFFLRALRRAIVVISGDGWYNASGIAASPPIALKGIEVDDVTPVLGVRGSIVDEQMGTNRAGFRVIVKNLSTGRAVAAVTKDESLSRTDRGESMGGGYQVTIVDVETGRAAQIGDRLEISVRSPDPLIGVQPLQYTVTAEDVKRSRVELADLVAYEIPTETELLRNYPNPFNPETWIPYRLAEDAFVTLTIYDGSGRVIRTLDVGPRIAAVYERRSKAVYWDGRNRLGEQVASGVYFYTLSADDYFATRKMVILK